MKKSKYMLFLVIILLVMLALQYLIDDVLVPGGNIFSKISNIISWAIIVFFLVMPWISIKTYKITIKTKTSATVISKTYDAIQTTDKHIFLNTDDIIPWKRHSDKLQQRLKIGKTYIIKTYRPWLAVNYKNILSATEVKNKK